MSWTERVRNRVKKGGTYTMNSIGKVKVIGSISQYGGNGSGGALFVKCEIIETKNEQRYPVGSTHELNAEFMF